MLYFGHPVHTILPLKNSTARISHLRTNIDPVPELTPNGPNQKLNLNYSSPQISIPFQFQMLLSTLMKRQVRYGIQPPPSVTCSIQMALNKWNVCQSTLVCHCNLNLKTLLHPYAYFSYPFFPFPSSPSSCACCFSSSPSYASWTWKALTALTSLVAAGIILH